MGLDPDAPSEDDEPQAQDQAEQQQESQQFGKDLSQRETAFTRGSESFENELGD